MNSLLRRIGPLPLLILVVGAFLVMGMAARPAAPVNAGTPAAAKPMAAPAQAVLTIEGDLPKHGSLSIADLEALGARDVRWTHGKRDDVFRGTPIIGILKAFGFNPGDEGPGVPLDRKRRGWKLLCIAEGDDGYRATFSCAELDDEIGKTEAYVAWTMNGAPVPSNEGPLRLVVPTDARGARGVRRVKKLIVVLP